METQREERFEYVNFAKQSRIFEGVERKEVKKNNKKGQRKERKVTYQRKHETQNLSEKNGLTEEVPKTTLKKE